MLMMFARETECICSVRCIDLVALWCSCHQQQCVHQGGEWHHGVDWVIGDVDCQVGQWFEFVSFESGGIVLSSAVPCHLNCQCNGVRLHFVGLNIPPLAWSRLCHRSRLHCMWGRMLSSAYWPDALWMRLVSSSNALRPSDNRMSQMLECSIDGVASDW